MDGPWLQTAILCERIEADEHGRLAALDIVDAVEVEPNHPLALNLIIAVVRGGWQGSLALRIVARDPKGEPIAIMEATGDPPPIPYAIARIVVPIEMAVGAAGVFWFDVVLGDQTVTRVPLHVAWRAAP